MYKLPQLPHDQFAAFVCALFNQLLDDDFTLNENGKLIESASEEVTILAVPLSIEEFPKAAAWSLKNATDAFLHENKNNIKGTFIVATNYALILRFQYQLDILNLSMDCLYLDWEAISVLVDNPNSKFSFPQFYPNLNFQQLPINIEDYRGRVNYYKKGIEIKSKIKGDTSIDIVRFRALLAYEYEKSEEYIFALNENKTNVEVLKKVSKSKIDNEWIPFITVTYSAIGALYYKLGDYEEGIKWLEDLLSILDENDNAKDEHIYLSAIVGLLNGYIRVGLLDNALNVFENTENTITPNSPKMHITVFASLHLAGLRIYDSLKDYKKGLFHFNELWNQLPKIHKIVHDFSNKKELAEQFPYYYEQLASRNHLINTTENNKLSKSSTELPFSIKQVHIKAFQAIRDLKIETIPVDAKWIFITGKNGTGKSSLLQALALGLLGETVEEYNLLSKKQETVISIELLQDGNNQIQTLKVEDKQSEFYRENDFENISMPVLTYGVSRLKIQKEEEVYDENTMINLFSAEGGNLSNIEKWLKDKALEGEGDSKQVQMVFSTLSSLMPSVSHIERNKSQIEYTENGEVITREHLASGNKSILAMVGDILIRLLRFFPDVDKTTNFKGIIIIDELDLHLHPSWQREMPWLLSKLFPKVQFICSTHSIIPFMGAPKNSVFFTVDRTEEEGTTIQQLDIDVSNLSANILLSSPLFEVSLLSKVAEDEGKSQEYRTESDYKEYDENVKNSAAFKRMEEKYGDIFGGQKSQK